MAPIIRPTRAASGSGPATAAGRTSSGQCHRYSEYEMRPRKRAGRQPSSRAGRLAWPAIPGSIASAQPSVGSSAATPGKGVSVLMITPAAPIIPSPTQPAAVAAAAGSLARRAAPTARMAPMASSQARVGSEKKAHGWLALVSHSDSANEPAAMATASQPIRRTRFDPQTGEAAGDDQEQGRPEEVELLLDPERPEMQQRRRGELRLQVVGRLEGKAQVRDVQRGGDPVLRDVARTQRRQHRDRRDDRHQDQQGGRRQQPASPPRIEGQQRDRPARVELAKQQPGDQEPRQHEEDVDADVAAAQAGHTRVVEQDEHDGDRAESLDVGPEAGALGQLLVRSGDRSTSGQAFDEREVARSLALPGQAASLVRGPEGLAPRGLRADRRGAAARRRGRPASPGA